MKVSHEFTYRVRAKWAITLEWKINSTNKYEILY